MNKLIVMLLFFVPNLLIAQTSWTHYFSTLEINDAIEYQDKIWIATDNGVYTIDKASKAIQHYERSNSLITDNHVQTLTTDVLGNLWIGTYDVVLAKVAPGGTWQTTSYPNMANNEYVAASVVDNTGKVWVGTNERLLSYNGTAWQHHPSITITNSYISDIELAGNGQLKVLTDSLHTFDITNNTLVSTTGIGPSASYDGQDLYIDGNSTVWILSTFTNLPSYSTITKIQNGQITTYDMYQDLPVAPLNEANFAIHHSTGTLCFAADSSKLVYYDPMADTWEVDDQYQFTLPVPIKELINDKDGDLWFFNQDVAMKVDIIFPETVSFADRKPFDREAVIAADNNGIVYVTNKDDCNDVPLLKITNGVWDTVQILGGIVTGVNSVTFDTNNKMWATAYVNQTSIAILEQANSGWIVHNNTSSGNVLPNLVGTNDFNQILVDQLGVVWVVYGENQIYKYENGMWFNVYNTTHQSTEIERIQVDQNGDLWWFEWDDVKKLDKNTNTVQIISSSGMSNLHDLHIDQTTGELLLLGGYPTSDIKEYANGVWTTVVSFNTFVYRLDVLQGKIYAAYDELYVYDTANSSLSVYDTTKLTDIGIVRVNPIDGSVWMMDEFGKDIIVMETMIMNNNAEQVELLENALQIYPNPTDQYLQINSSLLDKGSVNQIQIINSIGQIIQTIAPTTTIRVDQLPQGVYWLQLETKNHKYHQAFIKK